MVVARAKLLRSTIWRSPSLSLHISRLGTKRPRSRQFALTDKATGQCLGPEVLSCSRRDLFFTQTSTYAISSDTADTQGNTLISQPGEAVTPVSLDKGINNTATTACRTCDNRHRVTLLAAFILPSSHPLGQTLTLTEPAKTFIVATNSLPLFPRNGFSPTRPHVSLSPVAHLSHHLYRLAPTRHTPRPLLELLTETSFTRDTITHHIHSTCPTQQEPPRAPNPLPQMKARTAAHQATRLYCSLSHSASVLSSPTYGMLALSHCLPAQQLTYPSQDHCRCQVLLPL